jgi:proline iminopeptidase
VSHAPIPPPRTSGFTTSTPVPLYWARWGSANAPTLLVLHGGPGAHHDYLLPQMLALSDEYEMVFYDQRGGGKSKPNGLDPITWRTHVEDLARVVPELIAGPLTLVGYSWGGLLAMLYAVAAHSEANAMRWPQVGRLLLIDPASVTREHRKAFEVTFAERSEAAWVRGERSGLAASGLREGDPAAFRQRSFALSVAGYFLDPKMASELTPFRISSRVQQSVWESLGDFDLRPGLRELRVPTLVVHGREDPIPLASSEDIAAALSARLVVLDDCGHVPYIERPAPLFAAMRSFLKDPASAAAE